MAGAIAAAILALINLSVYLITKRERRKPSEPYARADPLRVTSAGVRLWRDSDRAVDGWPVTFAPSYSRGCWQTSALSGEGG